MSLDFFRVWDEYVEQATKLPTKPQGINQGVKETSPPVVGILPGKTVPYNIVQLEANRFAVDVAVPGFDKDELSVTVEDGKLVVAGDQPTETECDYTVLQRGIFNKFKLTLQLGENVEVLNASLDNGVLEVILEREPKDEEDGIRRVDIW